MSNNKVITLERTYNENETFGVMKLPTGEILQTIELPNKNNQQRVSCIPEGEYILKLRESPIVRKTSKGKYLRGWEVTDVPNRTFIMIHIANTTKDILGCIGVGMVRGMLAGTPAVLRSSEAFNIFMKALTENEYTLVIKEKE